MNRRQLLAAPLALAVPSASAPNKTLPNQRGVSELEGRMWRDKYALSFVPVRIRVSLEEGAGVWNADGSLCKSFQAVRFHLYGAGGAYAFLRDGKVTYA